MTAEWSAADILRDLLPDGPEVVPGTLAIETERVTSADDVLTAFREFDGTGWICLTTCRAILRFSSSQDLKAISGWPLAGEAVKDRTSLHVNRVQDFWELVRLTATESGDGSLLVRSSFLARDKGRLRYETAWSPDDAGGQRELRPRAFRFIGFADARKEASR